MCCVASQLAFNVNNKEVCMPSKKVKGRGCAIVMARRVAICHSSCVASQAHVLRNRCSMSENFLDNLNSIGSGVYRCQDLHLMAIARNKNNRHLTKMGTLQPGVPSLQYECFQLSTQVTAHAVATPCFVREGLGKQQVN